MNINNVTFNKKIILVVVVILVAVGFFFVTTDNKVENIDLEELILKAFDSNRPILIKENDKYFYVKTNGKLINEEHYKRAEEFVGEYTKVDDGHSYRLINRNGNTVIEFEQYRSTEYIPEYDVWVIDDILYDSKLKPILSEEFEVEYIGQGYFEFYNFSTEESGILNYKGKIICSLNESNISANISENEYDQSELYAKIYTDDKSYVVSLQTGDILYEHTDDSLYSSSDGIFYSYSDNMEYFYFNNDKLAYKIADVSNLKVHNYENKILEIDYGYNYEDKGKTQRYYYYDLKNNKFLEEEPEKSEVINNLEKLTAGYAIFQQNSKHGVLYDGKVLIPAEYEDMGLLPLESFAYMNSKGKPLALGKKNKKIYLINLKNNKVVETLEVENFDIEYTFIHGYSYDKSYKKVNNFVYNLETGKMINIEDSYDVAIYTNYITINGANSKVYYNNKLEEIYRIQEKS